MDLTTSYLGMTLKNPLIAGASPLSRDVSSARRVEDSGISALVVYSLFQEQIEHDAVLHEHYMAFGAESYAEALSYVPTHVGFPRGPDEYLEHIRQLKASLSIPVIGSLNAASEGGWIEYANGIEQAGADALELNIYFVAADPEVSSADVEQRHLDIIRAVCDSVNIPVAVKVGPYFSAFAHFARQVELAGARGMVLFNRFYQPDIDLETLTVEQNLRFSAGHEMRVPLRWVAILNGCLNLSLAASTGVYTSFDVLKLMMAGAHGTQLVATLLRNGVGVTRTILEGIEEWMEDHEYESIEQMQGSMSQATCPDPVAFERGNYMRQLTEYQTQI